MKKQLLLYLLLLTCFSGIFAQRLVISEIYYNAPNSGLDSLEYVEIYNKDTTTVNLKGYTFRKAFIDTLPDVTLAAGAYYVVTADSNFYKKFVKTSARQWRRGALSNTGASIQLWSDANIFIDSVAYRVTAPWNTAANGQGMSLELCDINANNDLAASWNAASTAIGATIRNQNGQQIALLGTPGKANKCATGGGGTGTLVLRNINAQIAKNTTANINIAQQNNLQANAITNSAVVTNPTNGTAAKGTAGGGNTNTLIVYTPKNGFFGRDSFQYSACTVNGCDTATIRINVINPRYNTTTIGKATAATTGIGVSPDSLNSYVQFDGVVHSPNFATIGLQFTLIDGKFKTDGIEAVRANPIVDYTLNVGDRLRVRGRIIQTAGVNRIVVDSLWKTASGITLHEPTVVSVLDESTENMLVQLYNVSIIDTTKWVNTGAANFFTVEVTPDNGLTKYQVRIDKDLAELSNWAAPKGSFDLVGIGYQAVTAGGGGSGQLVSYPIIPRYRSDFRVATPTNDLALSKNIDIFPNPFEHQLTLLLKEQMDNVIVKDILGRVVATIRTPNAQEIITTTSWTPGVYFISVQKGNRQYIAKFVK